MGSIGERDGAFEHRVRTAIRGAYADGCPADQKALGNLVLKPIGLPRCEDRVGDKAHSLRSCLRRPCVRMSPEAQSIMTALLHGKRSAIQLIHNSDAFRASGTRGWSVAARLVALWLEEDLTWALRGRDLKAKLDLYGMWL